MLFVIKNNKTITNKSLVIKFLEIFLAQVYFQVLAQQNFGFGMICSIIIRILLLSDFLLVIIPKNRALHYFP